MYRRLEKITKPLIKLRFKSAQKGILTPVFLPQGSQETSCHCCLTVVGLAQSIEHLTAEQEVAGLIPGAGPIVRVLKITEK